MSDSTGRLHALFAAAAQSGDARAWLFHLDKVGASAALHAAAGAPALLQMRFHSFQRMEPAHTVPAVRDVLVVVKDGAVPLVAPFGVFADPVGPTLAQLSGATAFADPARGSARAVLVRDPDPDARASVYMYFAWKPSGALVISSKTIPHDVHPRAAPAISAMLARFLQPRDAAALRAAAATALDAPLPDFLAATLPLLSPARATFWEMLAFDSRAQTPCLFCFARAVVPCECPTPLRRRARRRALTATATPATEARPGPTGFADIVASAMRNDSNGLILATWREIAARGAGAGARPPPRVIGAIVTPYDIVFDDGAAARDVIQHVVARAQSPAHRALLAAHAHAADGPTAAGVRGDAPVADVSATSSWGGERSSSRSGGAAPAKKRRRAEAACFEGSSVTAAGVSGEGDAGRRECGQCGRAVDGGAEGLARHVAQLHSRRRHFRCAMPRCGQTFSSNPNLKRHMTTIHEGRPFGCSMCRAAFKSGAALQKHMGIAHVDAKHTYTCPHCGFSFGRRGVLVRHIARRHKEGPDGEPKAAVADAGGGDVLAFQCFAIGCEVRFEKWGDLVTHGEMRHGGRPFQCEQCRAAFREEQGLSLHIRENHDVGGRGGGRTGGGMRLQHEDESEGE